MGLIMDYLEDSAELFGQFLNRNTERLSVTAREAPALFFHDCPLCTYSFQTDSALQDHIFDVHRGARAYVRVDDAIVSDLIYTEKVPTHIVLITTQAGGLLNLTVGEERYQVPLMVGLPLDIRHYVPNSYRGSVDLTIRFGIQEQRFQIFCVEVPTMELDKLDGLVFQLQEPMLRGQVPDWSHFRTEHLVRIKGRDLEVRYLLGFFEYLLGCSLECDGQNAAGRCFERAFGFLRPFHTNCAHTVRCLLALKMNWFSMLRHCGPESRFYLANTFFNNGGLKISIFTKSATELQNLVEGIWIDRLQEQTLELLQAYYRQDFERALDTVTGLLRTSEKLNKNSEEKLKLIEGRSFLAIGDMPAARRAYDYFVHHPIFSREAQQVIGVLKT